MKCNSVGTQFNFHPECEKEGITHLAFADDLMIFCRGDTGSVEVVRDCLKGVWGGLWSESKFYEV